MLIVLLKGTGVNKAMLSRGYKEVNVTNVKTLMSDVLKHSLWS